LPAVAVVPRRKAPGRPPEDDPRENTWFARVADVARELRLAVATPDDPNDPGFVARIAALAPDFLFSFYYRRMLSPALLATARRGALNLHGSLLPRYRGRAPVNWAVLNGEVETGATLHYMTAKPDAGDIVAQRAVAIGPDDTAREVQDRVAAAGAALLDDILPALVAGTAPRRANDLAWPARRVHDLVRAVAPPYPGAFVDLPGGRLAVLRTRRLAAPPPGAASSTGIYVQGERAFARCGDGAHLEILDAAIGGAPAGAAAIAALAVPR